MLGSSVEALSVEDTGGELNFRPCEILPWRTNPRYNGFEEMLCYFAALLSGGGEQLL